MSRDNQSLKQFFGVSKKFFATDAVAFTWKSALCFNSNVLGTSSSNHSAISIKNTTNLFTSYVIIMSVPANRQTFS